MFNYSPSCPTSTLHADTPPFPCRRLSPQFSRRRTASFLDRPSFADTPLSLRTSSTERMWARDAIKAKSCCGGTEKETVVFVRLASFRPCCLVKIPIVGGYSWRYTVRIDCVYIDNQAALDDALKTWCQWSQAAHSGGLVEAIDPYPSWRASAQDLYNRTRRTRILCIVIVSCRPFHARYLWL